MKLIWTKSNQPLSLLIRWGLKEESSHFAIVFDEKIVFHSNLYGAHIEWYNTYKKSVTIVHELDFKLSLEQEEKIYQEVINANDGKSYDIKALIYFMWRGILYRFLKIPFPIYNAWQGPNSLLCTGLAQEIPKDIIPQLEDINDYEMISPEKLYQIIIAKQIK